MNLGIERAHSNNRRAVIDTADWVANWRSGICVRNRIFWFWTGFCLELFFWLSTLEWEVNTLSTCLLNISHCDRYIARIPATAKMNTRYHVPLINLHSGKARIQITEMQSNEENAEETLTDREFRYSIYLNKSGKVSWRRCHSAMTLKDG